MSWLGLDVGGAHLKLADGAGFALSRYFPLWQRPADLASALHDLLKTAPAADRLVVTMTGELADCFQTKSEGVTSILDAVSKAAAGWGISVYLTDGTLASISEAKARPLLAAASNWHALASFAGRYAPNGGAVVFDVGSTTCDIIPLVDGGVCARASTDPERLAEGELIYTGVQRSPLCALVKAFPWRGRQVPVAHEVFATTWDAWLTLGDLPEEPHCLHTADGRPATRSAAFDRLARSICADRDMFSDADAHAAATAVARAQQALVAIALQGVVERMSQPPQTAIISGRGEFLARRVLARAQPGVRIVSLADEMGPDLSIAATAHALAVLARENQP